MAAGGFVLLGLGCFARNIYSHIDVYEHSSPGKIFGKSDKHGGKWDHSSDAEYISAASLNEAADLAVLAGIVESAANYLKTAEEFTGGGGRTFGSCAG
ncbi:MAG: hypothetical protein K2Q25_14605 [Mycobacteriaceae bacterium]|nr:hypothetical protein [Mycobacteriaceae bacterium]